jgi:hypothetical protein
MVNPSRYDQIISLVPKGSTWDPLGSVLPLQDDPHDFVFDTNLPSTLFRIEVNGVYFGQVTSDVNGDANVSLTLTQGPKTIDLVTMDGSSKFTAYASVRATATWHAAWADQADALDESIDATKKSVRIDDANITFLEENFGRRLRQPNDIAYVTGNYRVALRELHQAYRFWGGRLAGLRQAVSALTGVNPLRVPRAWRPRWVVGDQLLPNGNLRTHSRVTTTDLDAVSSTLNIRLRTYVHAALAGNSANNVFPGPFTNPPAPERLWIVAASGYDGGNITITGTDVDGDAVTETVTVPVVGALTAYATINYFRTVTSAQKAAIGASAATVSIGLFSSKFLRIVSIGDHSPPGSGAASRNLQVATVSGATSLVWDGFTAGAVPIPVSGRYTIGDGFGAQARIYSRLQETFALNNKARLYLSMDDRPIVAVPLVTGGATPTAAQVATDIEAAFDRSPAYGGAQATGTISVTAFGSVPDGETFTLTDALGNAATFEFDNNAVVGAGNILVDLTGVASNNALAIRIQTAVQQARPVIIGDVAVGVVTLRQGFSGTAGNTTITDGGTTTGWTHDAAFAGGTNSASYGAAGNIADAITGPTSVTLRARSPSATLSSSAVQLFGGGADAGANVFGAPVRTAALSAGPAAAAVSVVAAGTGTAALAAFNGVVHAPFADNVATAPGPILALDRPASLEVRFSTLYAGGNIRITGTDTNGAIVTEDFVAVLGGRRVTSGSTASSPDGGLTIYTPQGFSSAVRAGMRFRSLGGATSGETSIIRYAAPSQNLPGLDLRLRTTLTSGGITSWEIVEEAVVRGSVVFATVTSVVNIAPAGGATGTAAVYVREASELYGYDVMIGRDFRRQNGTTSLTVAALTGVGDTAVVTETTAAYLSQPRDFQGYLRISGAAASAGANNGLHRIYTLAPALVGGSTWVVQHEYAHLGKRFVAETASMTWEVFAAGELQHVIRNDTATSTLTLLGEWGLFDAHAVAEPVELASNILLQARGESIGLGTITVDVDTRFTPTALPQTDAIAIISGDTTGNGGGIPDGWTTTNMSRTASTMTYPGALGALRFLALTAAAGDMTMVASAPRVLDYLGFQIRISAYVQQTAAATRDVRIDVSFDGTTFNNGTPVAVAETVTIAAGDGQLVPTLVQRTIEVPYNATACLVRIAYLAAAAANEVFAVERVDVIVPQITALAVGDNTVIRSAQRDAFGEILYVWAGSSLSSAERTGLGIVSLPETVATNPGHIDHATNAHGVWERFDISEYTASVPVNLRGVYGVTSAPNVFEWSSATLVNMTYEVGTPPRLGYVRPSRVSRVAGEALTITAPSNATLALPSTHEGPFPEEASATERLYEGTIPVPQTPLAGSVAFPWRFTSNTAIQIASVAAGDAASDAVYNSAAAYTIDYDTMIRATSPVIDLGAAFADYLWLLDVRMYRRAEISTLSRTVEQQLVFRTDFRAVLEERSDQNQSTSSLIRDTGVFQEPVAAAKWRYVSSQLVEIDAASFDPNSIYTLTYTSVAGDQTRPAGVVIEARSATTSVGVAAALYEEMTIDQVVNRSNQFHQVRVTISDVVDTRDVSITSMGLRGIRLYGANPFAPGILSQDE